MPRTGCGAIYFENVMKIKIIILYSLLCIFWGTTWIAIKISLNEGMPPVLAVSYRFLIAGLIFWIIFFFRKEKLPLNRTAIKIYLQFGLINFSLSYAITYWATQFIYSNLSSIIWAGFPLVVTMMAHFTLPDERFTPKKILSISIGIIGTMLILSQGKQFGGSNVLVGIIALMISVFIAAWPNVYLKKHAKTVNTIQLNAVCQTLGGFILLLISSLIEPGQGMIWSQANILATLYLIIFGSVITWMIYFWLFSHLPVTQISYVAFFPPVIAIIAGWIVLDEILTPIVILGAVFIIGGALLISTQKKLQTSVH
jgi:drug/metabolite transporter (DMT)-like permease